MYYETKIIAAQPEPSRLAQGIMIGTLLSMILWTLIMLTAFFLI